MARVFITGSADGLGLMAARLLLEQGHEVVVHGRSDRRAAEALAAAPGAAGAVSGDLSSIGETKQLAGKVNGYGRFDAVIHNAGIGYQEPRRGNTVDGLPPVLAINTLAPYILTASIDRPRRLVYLSSGMQRHADGSLDDMTWEKRRWDGPQAYSETKLHDALIAFAVARRWPDVLSNAVEPGWVATKMGGPGARDDLDQGHRTQAWLAASDEPAARVSGRYFFHMRQKQPNPAANDVDIQERLLEACRRLTGVTLPA